MKLDFTTLDVFSSTRYTGNPVAIIPVPASAKESLTQTQKQAIASEFNLSEIVFLHLPTDPTSPERHIDIFTSHAEVPFAGHPTIGTSHYLLHTTKQTVTSLVTKAGRIPIRLDPETQNVRAEIPHNFHRHAVTWSTPLNDLANPTCSIVNGMSFIMVE
ncbi:putative isomerase, partial [Lachnellula willkommii]